MKVLISPLNFSLGMLSLIFSWLIVASLSGQTGPNPPGHNHAITSVTEVDSPEDVARTRIGVGEKVFLSSECYPDETITWTKISGGGALVTTGQYEATFTAPQNFTAGNDQTVIQAACSKGGKNTISFTIVKPNGVIMEIKDPFNQKTPLVVYDTTNVYILPEDVNFIKIRVKEDNCVAIATGYWSYANGLSHFDPFWRPEKAPNKMTGHVAGKGTQMDGFDNVRSETRGPSYYAGTFNWPITWRYGIASDCGIFAAVPHLAFINRNTSSGVATLNHTKGGMTDSETNP